MFARVLLLVAAAMFGGLGAFLLLAPDKLEEWLGIVAGGPQARTELRAFYGGLEIGLAAFLAVAAWRVSYTSAACLLLVMINGGPAIARVIGFAIDGSANTKLVGFLAIEIGFAVLGTWAWLQTDAAI